MRWSGWCSGSRGREVPRERLELFLGVIVGRCSRAGAGEVEGGRGGRDSQGDSSWRGQVRATYV